MMEKSYSVTIQEHKTENDLKEKHLHTSILSKKH